MQGLKNLVGNSLRLSFSLCALLLAIDKGAAGGVEELGDALANGDAGRRGSVCLRSHGYLAL